MVLPARSKPLWRFALRVSTTTARVILSLPNFRACTKARAVGEARSRAVFAQDDTRGDLSSFSCYIIVGACIARPWTLSADLFVGTDVLGGPQNTIIRNAINRQMRKRSFFARVLAFEADRPFCEAKLTPVPTRSEIICIFTCRFFTFQPLVSRALTHPTYVGSPLPERALEKIASSSDDLSAGVETVFTIQCSML